MDEKQKKRGPGRPKVELDSALVLRLVDVEGFGWLGGAREYTRRTGCWTCKETFKRRYQEYRFTEELLQRFNDKVGLKDKS